MPGTRSVGCDGWPELVCSSLTRLADARRPLPGGEVVNDRPSANHLSRRERSAKPGEGQSRALRQDLATCCLAVFVSLLPLQAQEPIRLGQVTVAGVDISGMTLDEARATLYDQLKDKLSFECLITDGVKQVKRRRQDLGIFLDLDRMLTQAQQGDGAVPLYLYADPNNMQSSFERLAEMFAFPGENAKPYGYQGEVLIKQGQYQRRIDARASAQRIAKEVAEDAANVRFNLTLIKSPPDVSTEDLAGIDAVIGQYVTRFNEGLVGRTTNLRLGVKAIDGLILKPGEVFSLNDTVGERTPERGYQKAIIFVGGNMVEGYGGGISQVTGTLFNAALEAGLEIVTYRVHSRPVSYIPLGRDATVAWGAFDMKFRNSTEHPIFIDYRAPGSRCVATLFGHGRPDWNVTVETKVEHLAERHITAELFRTITPPGGAPKRTRLGHSVYQWPADEPEPEPTTAD